MARPENEGRTLVFAAARPDHPALADGIMQPAE